VTGRNSPLMHWDTLLLAPTFIDREMAFRVPRFGLAINDMILIPDIPGNMSLTCGNAAFEECLAVGTPSCPETCKRE